MICRTFARTSVDMTGTRNNQRSLERLEDQLSAVGDLIERKRRASIGASYPFSRMDLRSAGQSTPEAR
jgi:hypothetical protein